MEYILNTVKGEINMRYMIDTRTIPKGRPSKKEQELAMWQLKEEYELGLSIPFTDAGSDTESIPLTQFKSQDELADAIYIASLALAEYKPVPEPIRTKLALEAKNYREHGRYSLIV